MHYSGLDPRAHYKIGVVYADDSPRVRTRLAANDTIEIHPLIETPSPIAPLEYIPQRATGTFDLMWRPSRAVAVTGAATRWEKYG